MTTRLAPLALCAALAAGPALADLVFPDLSYRTGPFAAGGIPFSDGYQDYFTLMNERDGGIGGVKARVPECETAYNTEKGVECYEATKGDGALIYQPLSTGITYQLIPKVEADHIPLHTMGYGRTSAANGKVFEWVFNYPANYWDGASVVIKYLMDENGGSLEGKKITLLYHNSAYGKEPIPTLEALSKKHGFKLTLIPVDSPGQEQKSQWLQIRRERPDVVVMWGWGVMNQVAIQEAANIGFPMDHFIGNWWAGAEHDVTPAGMAADGYKALNMNRVVDYPVFADIRTHVVDKGLAAGDGSNVGSVLYTRGMYAAMLAVEAAKTAQEMTGTAQIDAAMMRDGMEHLEMTAARMDALGMPGIGPEFSVSCADHGGSGMAIVQQWNAGDKKWVPLTDFIAPDAEVIAPLVEADSAAFAAENGIAPRCD
ncbi:ABC transporter permease [Rhodovulum sulfidophilum]|uniref:ABC transporter substrate-binding protein n=1 Tax=Rhodovulum visakhapatnamense TaxID=364297 RepID=A0A4R8FQW0_9RHOB|nr:ABC transporter substrate-binding protein [Rhodovulum visakhapatnamense]MBL3569539.1 ABC transporter substrate-binding protein [Rhodovulum visakhapatnamense]MBL3578235.1 ABC transporter substrate-binding protein [Rhodovulum visakhapatnamense]OLS42927.1 ABC transporter permease [Rhodovulum sulfidophilum]TDX28915.1 amino acid/amide ABC transporter substrate-binding protein (HAAT family) [Rhodovulum visakhapatnamense]